MLFQTLRHVEKTWLFAYKSQSVNRPVWSRVEKLKPSADICILHQALFGRSNREEFEGSGANWRM